MIASQLLLNRLDLPLILNGALAGLVSITAEPSLPVPGEAIVIGGIGALIMMAGSRLLEALRIDDVVGAVPVHLFAGIWGTLAVALTNPEASWIVQAVGIIAVGLFVSISALVVWGILKATSGIRLRPEQEERGGDLAEVGLRAYNLD
jgi:ammonium transporter, Amt family